MRKATVVLLATVVLIGTLVSSAFAGGGNHYPNGAEGFDSGMVPPPGFHLVHYDLFYGSSSLKDNNGDDVPAAALPGEFDLFVFADVTRLIYISKSTVLGGNWGMHVFVPIMRVSNFGTSRTGLGDIIVDPFILSWHRPNFHAALGLDIYLPTGSYDKTKLVNPGSNFVTFEPIFAFTARSNSGLGWSMKWHYDINTENSDTKLKPGQEIHFDYALGYDVRPTCTLGVAGYFYQQVTDDEADGVAVTDQRARVFSIGPGIRFAFPPQRLMLEFRPCFEFGAKNRPQGSALWAKLVYSF